MRIVPYTGKILVRDPFGNLPEWMRRFLIPSGSRTRRTLRACALEPEVTSAEMNRSERKSRRVYEAILFDRRILIRFTETII